MVRLFNFVILTFFLNTLIQAQVLKGCIKNTEEEEIPYVNIVFLHKDVGTCSNQDGYFELNIQNHQDDTVKISAIGYETILMPVKMLENNSLVTMQHAIQTLPTFAISSKEMAKNKYKFGFFKETKTTGTICSFVGTQYAVHIKNTIHKVGQIQTVYMQFSELYKANWVNVRIRIYACTKDDCSPGEDLLSENIIFKPKKGNNKIDVSKYNIFFPIEGIFVAMELLNTENIKNEEKKSVNPCLRCTFTTTDSLTYYSYMNRTWQHFYYWEDKSILSNALIGIEVITK